MRAAASATPGRKDTTTISKKCSTRSTRVSSAGLLGRPELTWSEGMAKRSLGHYDAAHNTIVVSRVFDRPSSPRYAIEYLLYHEMLHLKHPVRMRGLRRCVHSREFKADEALFPELRQALAFIKRL